jgi:hypothetical protein
MFMKENSPNKVKLHSQNRVIVQVYAACLVLFSLSPLFAFTFDVFTDKSGKFNLFQQNGYIWMATDGGVIRFNMATERADEYTTAQGLSDNFCMRAIGDDAGNIWVSSRAGLDRFDGTQWQTFSMKDGFSDTRVTSILNAKNGDIWFSTYTGITRLRSGGLAERSKPSGKMKPSGRPSLSKIVVTSARCAGKTAPATFYDILGRRVNLQPRYQNEFRLPLVNGVYIAVHQKQVR